MIRFYSSRELAACLGVNLARWKRWCREFLPPDPLGGLQSGYARQFNVDDAFTVYLGGHLVARLKLGVPQARHMVSELYPWMCRHGFFETPLHRIEEPQAGTKPSGRFQVLIQAGGSAQPGYVVREILADAPPQTAGGQGVLRYREWGGANAGGRGIDPYGEPLQVLNISALKERFARLLG